MFAVIKTGGKQYFVSPGQKIKIEKLNKKDGDEVIFDEVLLLDPSKNSGQENNKLEIGSPTIKGARVIGKVLSQGKAKKVIIFKYKAKKRYHLKKGHRQQFTEVEIKTIEV
jgi:large subunit ribosomal protein L21